MYNWFAEIYDRYTNVDYAAYAAWLKAEHGRSARVLEIGCGSGRLSEQILGWFDRLSACDPSEEMLALAAQRLPISRVELLRGDFSNLPVSGRFDLVVAATDVINYLTAEEMTEAFALVSGHLQSGGQFLFDITAADVLRNIWASFWRDEYETGDLIWEGVFQAQEQAVELTLHWYELQTDGRYRRFCEEQTVYVHEVEQLKLAWQAAGFSCREQFLKGERLFFRLEKNG